MYSWHSMQEWTLNVPESSSFPGKWKAIMLCRRGKSWQSSAKPFPSPDAPWVGIKLTGRVPLPNRALSLVESHALRPHWSAALTKSHSVKERRDRAMVVVFKEAKRQVCLCWEEEPCQSERYQRLKNKGGSDVRTWPVWCLVERRCCDSLIVWLQGNDCEKWLWAEWRR